MRLWIDTDECAHGMVRRQVRVRVDLFPEHGLEAGVGGAGVHKHLVHRAAQPRLVRVEGRVQAGQGGEVVVVPHHGLVVRVGHHVGFHQVGRDIPWFSLFVLQNVLVFDRHSLGVLGLPQPDKYKEERHDNEDGNDAGHDDNGEQVRVLDA